MKAVLIVLLGFTSLQTFGQLTLEHTYTNSSTMAGPDVNAVKQPLMVHLEADGSKYVFIDREAKTVTFYNLDHTFFKSISFAGATVLNEFGLPDILYISQHLFDTDDEIEFMYSQGYGAPGTPFTSKTEVINEDGSIVFSENGFPATKVNYHQQQYPIYNTSSGTKLMLSMNNNDVNIYSLQGELTSLIVPMIDENLSDMAYPNPAKTDISIPILHNSNNSTIELYDIDGRLVREVKVSSGVVEIKLDVQNLSSGTYFYILRNGKGENEAKKFIKI